VDTISQTRHANLLLLIARAGGITAFSNKIDCSHSQVSQLKNRSKHSISGQPREIGDDVARHIELMMELPVGWMDQPHPVFAPIPLATVVTARDNVVALETWPFPTVSPTRYRALPAADRARVEGFVQGLVEAWESGGGRERPPAAG